MNKEAVEWAKAQLAEGFSVEDLKKALIESGYSEDEADGIILAASSPGFVEEEPTPEPLPPAEPTPEPSPQPGEAQPTPKPEPPEDSKPAPTEHARHHRPEKSEAKPEEPRESSVKFSVDYREKASRLELFIRALYSIPVAIVLMALSYLLFIVWPLQWVHTLLLGKRNNALNGVLYSHANYFAHANSYIMLLTDERPPIVKGVGKLLLVGFAALVLVAVLAGVLVFYVAMPMLSGTELPVGI